MVGFLVTCDPFKEKRCVKEIFNILNDWVEKLYPNLDINKIVTEAWKIKKEQRKEKATVKLGGDIANYQPSDEDNKNVVTPKIDNDKVEE
jgi:hypothetical protein